MSSQDSMKAAMALPGSSDCCVVLDALPDVDGGVPVPPVPSGGGSVKSLRPLKTKIDGITTGRPVGNPADILERASKSLEQARQRVSNAGYCTRNAFVMLGDLVRTLLEFGENFKPADDDPIPVDEKEVSQVFPPKSKSEGTQVAPPMVDACTSPEPKPKKPRNRKSGGKKVAKGERSRTGTPTPDPAARCEREGAGGKRDTPAGTSETSLVAPPTYSAVVKGKGGKKKAKPYGKGKRKTAALVDSGSKTNGVSSSTKAGGEMSGEAPEVARVDEAVVSEHGADQGVAHDPTDASPAETFTEVVRRRKRKSPAVRDATESGPRVAGAKGGDNPRKQKAPSRKGPVPVVYVTRRDATEATEPGVYAELIGAVRPEKCGVRVRGLRVVANGAVRVELARPGDVQRLIGEVTEKCPNLCAQVPPKRRPRFMVQGIPTGAVEGDLLAAINDAVTPKLATTVETLKGDLKVLSTRKGAGKGTKSMVFEASPTVFGAVLLAKRIFVHWLACKVSEFTEVTRCYRCQGLGHVAKNCRAPAPSCGHCADVGHESRNCGKRAEPPRCALCKRTRKPDNHGVWDNNCPSNQQARGLLRQMTDYGS